MFYNPKYSEGKFTLRKHAYSKYVLKILPSTNENFQIKNSEIFLISAQNLDCGYSLEPPHVKAVLTSTHNLGRGGSNEYPQSRF